MKVETFPTSFRKAEGSFRSGERTHIFRLFYLDALRRVPGCRISSTTLRTAFLDWAADTGQPCLSFKDIAVAMDALGHRRIPSNGFRYLDVGFAADHPERKAELPMPRAVDENGLSNALADAMSRVDLALAELCEIRSALQSSCRDPARAMADCQR